MIREFIDVRKPKLGSYGRLMAMVVILLSAIVSLRADEPYARTRNYDLQHSKIILRFDVDQKKVIGEVVHPNHSP